MHPDVGVPLERRLEELSALNAIGDILNREADFPAALEGGASKTCRVARAALWLGFFNAGCPGRYAPRNVCGSCDSGPPACAQ